MRRPRCSLQSPAGKNDKQSLAKSSSLRTKPKFYCPIHWDSGHNPRPYIDESSISPLLYFVSITGAAYAYRLHNLKGPLTFDYHFLMPRIDKSNKKRRSRSWKSPMLPPYSRIKGPEERKTGRLLGRLPTHTRKYFYAGTKVPNANRASEEPKKQKVRQKEKGETDGEACLWLQGFFARVWACQKRHGRRFHLASGSIRIPVSICRRDPARKVSPISWIDITSSWLMRTATSIIHQNHHRSAATSGRSPVPAWHLELNSAGLSGCATLLMSHVCGLGLSVDAASMPAIPPLQPLFICLSFNIFWV
jgi:hypothetical protein